MPRACKTCGGNVEDRSLRCSNCKQSREDFLAAKREADATGGMVCGTFAPDGRPVYYVVPREADDTEHVRRAFALKNGRAMSPGEELLVSLARDRIGSLSRSVSEVRLAG